MYGGFGHVSDPVLEPRRGEYWVEKNTKQRVLIDGRDEGEYHLIYDNGHSYGWISKSNLLEYFSRWEDPWAKVKEICKHDGWVWKDSI